MNINRVLSAEELTEMICEERGIQPKRVIDIYPKGNIKLKRKLESLDFKKEMQHIEQEFSIT